MPSFTPTPLSRRGIPMPSDRDQDPKVLKLRTRDEVLAERRQREFLAKDIEAIHRRTYPELYK